MKYIVTWSAKTYFTCEVDANSESEARSKAFDILTGNFEHSYDSGVFQLETIEETE